MSDLSIIQELERINIGSDNEPSYLNLSYLIPHSQRQQHLPARPQPMNLPRYEEVMKDRPPKYSRQ